MKNLLYLAISLTLFTTTYTYSQTGPGGVLNQSANRLWIDVNELNGTLADGNPITVIPDKSGNGFNVSTHVSSWKPTYTSNSLNGFPTANYTSSNRLFSSSPDPSIENSEVTIFTVLKIDPVKRQLGMSINFSGSNWMGSYSNNSSSNINKLSSTYNVSSFSGITSAPVFNNFQILSQIFSSSNHRAYINSNILGNVPGTFLSGTSHTNYGIGAINVTTYYGLKGDFAETMVFNTALNNTQRIIIENYLSSKYAIDISGSGNDYYAQESTGHFHEVFGVGQLNGEANTQAQGTGIVEVSGPNDLADNEFLMIGHDNQNFNLFSGDVPASMPDAERWNRTWRVSETGEVGNTTLTFDMTGVGFGSPVTSYRLLIDPNQDGDFSDVVSPIVGTFDVNTQTLTFTNVDLNDGDYFTVAADRAIISINGGGDWTDPLTWNCFCVPSHLDSAIIDDGDVVNLDADTAINGLLINGTGSLTMNNFNLDVRESLTVNGTIDASAASLTFNGNNSSFLNLGGQNFNFNDITMNNGAGNSFTASNGTLTIDGTFFPTSGTLEDGSAQFIVNSTSASQSGSIGAIGTDATINETNFIVRRAINAGVAGWRHISSPLQSIQITQLDDDLPISGTGMPDGCSFGDGSGCYATLRYFDGSTFDTIPVHDVTHTMVTGRGYEIFMGDDLVTFSGVVYDNNGMLNPSTDIQVNAGGWELIGNPYASPIDFNLLTRGGSVGNYFYVRDENDASGWQWYDGGSNTSSSSDLANGIIAMSQGFWVENSGTVTFSQSAKVSDGETFVKSNTLTHTLEVTQVNGSKKGKFTLLIDPSASTQRDQIDIPTMPRMADMDHIQFGSQHENEAILALNKISGFEDKVVLPLTLNVLDEGEYQFTANNFEDLPSYKCIQIYDSQTDQVITVTNDMAYTFEVSSIDEDIHRFSLLLNQQNCATAQNGSTASLEDLEAQSVNMIQRDRLVEFTFDMQEQENFTVSVTNSLGQKIMNDLQWSVANGKRSIQIPEHIHGVLIIQLNNNGFNRTEKIFVK